MKNRPPAPVTIRDVAHAAGVSPASVSMALRGTGSISDKSRKRIRAIAKKLGYSPNPLLASIASRRFHIIDPERWSPVALLVCGSDVHPAERLQPETEQRAAELGYRIRAYDIRALRSPPDLGKQLYSQGCVGIIVTPLFGETRLPALPWEKFCVVGRGFNWFPTPFPVVRAEAFHAVCRVWERLRQHGYRRIGFAVLRHEPTHHDDAHRRAAALYCQSMAAAAAADIPVLDAPMVPWDVAAERTAEWVTKYRPEAVIGFNFGVSQWLATAGFKMPEDFGFAALHMDRSNTVGGRAVAGILNNLPAQQVCALELLDQRIRHRMFGLDDAPLQTLIPCPWVEGETLARRHRPAGTPAPVTTGAAEIGDLIPGNGGTHAPEHPPVATATVAG